MLTMAQPQTMSAAWIFADRTKRRSYDLSAEALGEGDREIR
jgi:hypothetical protein